MDVLKIRLPEDVKTSVLVSNRAGAAVFEAEDAEIGPFNPFAIDMASLPSGVYYVRIGGQDKVFSVVKK